MEHKKFMDIERIKEGYATGFNKGDLIYIEEKVDGANAAIRYDETTNSIVAQSRKQILTPTNNLRGFYGFAQRLDIDKIYEILGENLVAFGEWLCLSGDTIIKKTSAGKNSNYMTLREMYEYKNKPCPDRIHQRLDRGRPFVIKNVIDNPNISEKELFNLHNSTYFANFKKILNELLKSGWIQCEDGKYTATVEGIEWYEHYVRGDSWWDRYGLPKIFSLDFKTDKIIANQMIDIVYTGDKEVYKVTTRKGYSIKTTLNHPFLTPKGFVPLKELKEYDCVAITQMTNKRGHRRLGKGARKILNLMEEYKNKIGKCEKCGTDSCLEIHHIDCDYTNNVESNYMVLCSDCHKKIHSSDSWFKGFEYDYEFDYIVSIEYEGIEDCYDIAMNGDETTANFVANGFIVHNCKHTVKYPDDKYNNFYMYDVYDLETQSYLPQEKVVAIAENLGLTMVPIFYVGEFISWEHCMSFVGKSDLGAESGEGIVVKSQTRLNDPDYRHPFYLKIVGEKFCETKAHGHIKQTNPDVFAKLEADRELAEAIVTEARVTKILHKMVDEGIIPADWGSHDMGTIAKNLPRLVYEDCIKEESETVNAIDNFGKIANSIAMGVVRNKL